MSVDALQQADYEVIEWEGRGPTAPPRATARDFDTSQVWMLDDRQLRYWTAELGVTMYEIRDAIAVTQTRCATAIRAYLTRWKTHAATDAS